MGRWPPLRNKLFVFVFVFVYDKWSYGIVLFSGTMFVLGNPESEFSSSVYALEC